ncbi:TetR/AcrR family transcriptional regulator [Sphaerisporangium corydalis]|uniref:TetR/AcrR family transcriptional regulator n=1 Tax=Sphaerisporangium corydalis TaxID=1441875 RepID=A0ABV9EH85_9ACTN|nr:TetR/AcrR family transcriptional regulator [Sphaerisporangium corydalis]
MVVFAGQGDVQRTMALLWRTAGPGDPRTAPGPKPALSVDMIVDAAIAVADAEGMSSLSMRAVGERLGRTAMALYTYVPSKGELVDLMYDRALAELPRGYDGEAGWRAALTRWAGDGWAFYLRHPWVLQVSQARPVLGPNEYVMMETLLGVLRGTGLGAPVVRRLVGTLIYFVRGTVQPVAEARQAATATGVPDQEWWDGRSAQIAQVAPDFAERFPMVVWLGTEGASPLGDEADEPCPDDDRPYMEAEAEKTFQAGLTVLLDGIEAAMRRAGL